MYRSSTRSSPVRRLRPAATRASTSPRATIRRCRDPAAAPRALRNRARCRSRSRSGTRRPTLAELRPPPQQHATEGHGMKYSPLPLPPNVRAAAEEALGGGAIKEEFAWMSWAGTVWRLTGDGGVVVFVKRAAHLAGERGRLGWVVGRGPGPRGAGFFPQSGGDWLVPHVGPGVPVGRPSLRWGPGGGGGKLG